MTTIEINFFLKKKFHILDEFLVYNLYIDLVYSKKKMHKYNCILLNYNFTSQNLYKKKFHFLFAKQRA